MRTAAELRTAAALFTIKKAAGLLGVYDDREPIDGARASLHILRDFLTDVERNDCEEREWDPAAYCALAALSMDSRRAWVARNACWQSDRRGEFVRDRVAERIRLAAVVGVPVGRLSRLTAESIERLLAGDDDVEIARGPLPARFTPPHRFESVSGSAEALVLRHRWVPRRLERVAAVLGAPDAVAEIDLVIERFEAVCRAAGVGPHDAENMTTDGFDLWRLPASRDVARLTRQLRRARGESR